MRDADFLPVKKQKDMNVGVDLCAAALSVPPDGPGTLEFGLLSSGFAEIWGEESYTTSLSHLITACESLTFCKTPHFYGSIF